MIALEATHPEDRDFAVNGPLWNSHVIPTVNESVGEVEDRRRVIQQASRRVKRSVEDQALILASTTEPLPSPTSLQTSMRGHKTCVGCKQCTERGGSSISTTRHSESENSKPPPSDTRRR